VYHATVRCKSTPQDLHQRTFSGTIFTQQCQNFPGVELQVHFRNVDRLDEADVADMLTEAELLRLLEEGGADE